MVSLAVLILLFAIVIFEVSFNALKEMNALEVSEEDKRNYEILKAKNLASSSSVAVE